MQQATSWRTAYEYVSHPEVYLDAENITQLMRRACHGVPAFDQVNAQDELASLSDWHFTQKERFDEIFRADTTQDARDAMLANSLPFAASLGSWLQGLSAPGQFESHAQLRLMAMHAIDVGAGKPEASRYDEFRTLLRLCGMSEYAVDATRLHAVPDVLDTMFVVPSLWIAMSRRSDHFHRELCAVNHCMRVVGILPGWASLRDLGGYSIDWDRLHCGKSAFDVACDDLVLESREILETLRSQDDETCQIIDQTIHWQVALIKRVNAALFAACQSHANPEHAMIRLVQRRAREGAVYHQNFRLSGKPLSEWMRQARTDPKPLVDAIAQSRLVRPGDPERSRLLSDLISPTGKMFRIFSPHDVAIIRRWIVALDAPSAPASTLEFVAPETPQRSDVKVGDPDLGSVPHNIREAYHLLLGRALLPKTREFAIDYVEEWLAHAKASLSETRRKLPEQWSAGVVRQWLLEEHDKNGEEHQSNLNSQDMPTREEVIESSVQLAPLTLIDGAWLQGFTDINLASSRVGSFLYQTYWDELGNGSYDINHPKIYRDVLRGMGVELHPTQTWEFTSDERLFDDSFKLPVFWLCLGKLPRTYKATILGMNLAMEFSGVGSGYRSAHRFLTHYGFSTHFVDLHNTIDNVSTGHSAWAADAIDNHMQDVGQTYDQSRLDAEWMKVRVGFESLNPVSTRSFERGYSKFKKDASAHEPKRADLLHHVTLD